MPSQKRRRRDDSPECSSVKSIPKRARHIQEFQKREKKRQRRLEEEKSLKLIAQLQREEREAELEREKKDREALLACIDEERKERRRAIQAAFDKRKRVNSVDRQRLEQDLEYVDSQYEDMRKNIVASEEPTVSEVPEVPEENPQESPETEKRLQQLEEMARKEPTEVPYAQLQAYKYVCVFLEEQGLDTAQKSRFQKAHEKCKTNGWR